MYHFSEFNVIPVIISLEVRQSLVQLAEKMENEAQGTRASSEAVKEMKSPMQF